ncbi:hypothetical protein PEC302107_12950 [Pectobacterium araliae]|uniref:non-ribosomal peptide synthetase n=1 Tax=Pectobacterium araliae TaxID=3073862 RepID=UPI00207EA658|nr:hypothetical protein PEC302107_12950 [Pectobacterium carotovorum subsp. carotovorum]
MSETSVVFDSASSDLSADFLQLPLVAAQPGIWFAEQLAQVRHDFTVAHAIELNGPLDRDCLDRAIRQGLSEADTVHARFVVNDDGEPVQHLPRHPLIHAPEWRDLSEKAEAEAEAWALIHQDLVADLPADGEQPLYRQVVMKVGNAPERWLWYQRFHHLLLDGFSFDALTRRIVDIYNALRSGRAPAASPFTPFAPVVAEYQDWLASPEYQRSAEFWQQHAADLPAPVSLATEMCEPAEPDLRSLQQQVDISVAPSAEVVMAALAIYLYRMSGEPTLSIGFPFMRRIGSAALCVTGPVVNVLPLQLTLRPTMTLAEVDKMFATEIKTVRRHQRYEAEQLRRDLGRVGGEGLYDPVINFKIYQDALMLEGTPAITHALAMGPVEDMEFELGRLGEQLHLTLVANPKRYSEQTLQWHAERIAYLLQQLVALPETEIADVSLLPSEEKERIAAWGQGATLPLPKGITTVVDLFLQQATRQPDAIAVACGDERLTYRELSTRVTQLARLLIARGIGTEDVVAIGVPRSVDAIVAIFGVLTSGAAYLPLDLDYPPERMALMLEDARPALLLTHQAVASHMPPQTVTVCLDDEETRRLCAMLPEHPVTDTERREPLCGENLAYMIYTSGSTGKPKGVMSTHRGLLNLLISHGEQLFGPAITRFFHSHGRRLRAGHTVSFSFDSSWEPLFCLILGAELYVFDEDQRRDSWALVQKLRQLPVDLLDITPSFFSQLVDSGLLDDEQPKPAFIMLGGEAATPSLWQRIRQHPEIEFHNYYGPSEYTIDTLGANVQVADQPVIGRPVANTSAWLLDDRLQPVPVGGAGELYISGTGIARGYLRRPDLTAARFVANPFQAGDVMYRTGDVMRWRTDGQLVFIGRVDHQIKVRGFRIELGEVESALVALPEVSTAVVIAEPNGVTYRLVGYCSVPDAAVRSQPDIVTSLQAQLAARLPDYMVPSLLVVLEALPLTVNGKIDRQALPKPQFSALPNSGRQPGNEQEALICQAVAAILGLENIGVDDDFFSLGGDSISAMALGSRLRRAGWQLRAKDIFAQRIPERMAQTMLPLECAPSQPSVPRQGVINGLPIVRWFAQHGIERQFSHGVYLQVPPALQLEQIEQALRVLVNTHPALAARVCDGALTISEPAPDGRYCRDWSIEEDKDASAGAALAALSHQIKPEAGVMMQAARLRHGEQACGLVLVIHHLVVDGISWRVLLHELRLVAEAIMAERPITLAEEEYSLMGWSTHLLATASHRRGELAFWQAMWRDEVRMLGARRLDPARDRQSTQQVERRLLSAEQTTALLVDLPQQYRATVDEVLLTALGMACSRCYQTRALRVMMESHGRSDEAGFDLGRTVGWLTAEYPVCFNWDNTDATTPAYMLTAVKNVLRAVPDNGVGYGQLRWLDEIGASALTVLEEQNTPEILFNYLGRFGRQVGPWSPCGTADSFRDVFVATQAEQSPLSHALEINLFVDEQGSLPQLAILWGWADGIFTAQAISELHDALVAAVGELTDFSRQQPQRTADTLTLSEIGMPGMTAETLAQLRQQHGPLSAVLPLMPLQQGLLFHAQLAENRGSYNSLVRLSLHEPLGAEQIRKALDALVRRYPQLAARFDTELAAQPLQVVPLLRDDISYWPLTEHTLPTAESAALWELEHQELTRDLFRQPHAMLHALLVSHGQSQTLFLNAHHLVVDGWSTPVLLRDFFALLRGDTLPPVTDYAQVVLQLTGRDLEVSRQVWREALVNARPTILFDKQSDTEAVRELELLLDSALEQAMLRLCRQQGLTLNTLIQGIWGVLLSTYSGSQDILFGSPVSGRFGAFDGAETQVGLFSNTLPVRVRVDPTLPLLSQLAALQHQQIQLIEHDGLGLGDIQKLAGVGTLFDTLLVVENYPEGDALDSRCTEVSNRGYTHYPLTLLVLPGEHLRLLMEYRDSVPQPERLLQRLQHLLAQLVAQPELPLSAWNLLLPEETQFIDEVNRTQHVVPSGTLHQAVAEQALRTPDGVALVDCQHRLTYRQMMHHIQGVAQRLRDAGVQPGDIVAIALPRSVRLSLALSAVLACGAAWLPLDTGYPDERLAMMVEDAQPRLILTESALLPRFAQQGQVLILDALIAESALPAYHRVDVKSDAAAYVLYTSGSTGRPKGVVVSHRAIVNRLWWMQDQYPLTHEDVVLQKTPCSFDVSVWEFFWPLMTGATLVMAPPDSHRDPSMLKQLIHEHAVTTLHFVPSMLAAFVNALEQGAGEDNGCDSLLRVFCSGEALSRELAMNWQALVGAPLHNLYGPTEAAVDVTYQPAFGMALADCTAPGIPIGLPVWNTQLRILDACLRPVPPGVAGDLYLCGRQLAQGYLRRPDLTASRFVADPFAAGERMYRTGDIARWLDDGTVEYLGRSDDQLKIRGQRIELGEIEQALLAQPQVAQAVVCARELSGHTSTTHGADGRQLVAWLIPQDGRELDIPALQQALARRLPAHMLPVSYVPMTDFPLSANGKLNRKALPMPEMMRTEGRVPVTESERFIAGRFAEILQCDRVFADDDFFALGGHSLLAMQLAADIRRYSQYAMSVGQIMAQRSVEKLAKLLEGADEPDSAESHGSGEILPLRAGNGPALFCIHPASGFAWQYSGLLRYLGGNYPIIGLQSPRPQGGIAHCASVDEMCERHLAALRRLQPHGPYFLLGYSLGGTLAHGIAARLQQSGEEVAFLGLLDTYPAEGQDWSGPSEDEARQEVEREQAEFMNAAEEERDAQLRADKAAMFKDIVANYRDAVRLLSTATSPCYHGDATLFVATRTLPADMDVKASWAPYIDGVTLYPQSSEHADILSPHTLVELGPLLDKLLTKALSATV